jgi:hypothetical protein
VWGQTGPPERGSRSSRSCCRLDGSGSCSTLRGLRLASVVLYPARRFRCRFAPAGLALRRHGRVKIEERRNPPAHAARALQFTPAGGVNSRPHATRLGRARWRSHPRTERPRRRRGVGLRLVPCRRFCVRRGQANCTTPERSRSPRALCDAADGAGKQRTGRLPKRFHVTQNATPEPGGCRLLLASETVYSSGSCWTERAGFEPAMEL